MRAVFLLSIWLSCEIARCQKTKIQIAAQEGRPVTISCPYDAKYEDYPKYFSKGSFNGSTSTLIYINKPFNDVKENGKYSFWDDIIERILYVTIHNVNREDGGTYWCRIEANSEAKFDPTREIKLRVDKTNTINTTLQVAPPEDVHTEFPARAKVLYFSAATAFVMLLSVLMIFYFILRKQGQETVRAITGQEEGSGNTCGRGSVSLALSEPPQRIFHRGSTRTSHQQERPHDPPHCEQEGPGGASAGELSRADAQTSEIHTTIRHTQT